MKELIGRTYARCFGSARYRRLNSLLLYLSLRGLGFDNWRDHVVSGEDFFVRSLGLGDIERPLVLDVGAYHGEYAKVVRRYSRTADIYCFEPHPRSFEILQKTARDHGLIALPLACGLYSGKAKLFDYASRDGSKEATIYREVFEELHLGECPSEHHQPALGPPGGTAGHASIIAVSLWACWAALPGPTSTRTRPAWSSAGRRRRPE